ncbi:TIGR01459 family HAD-type hydrolase [Lachnospiraceae bacterium OttesenSCG-928-E19]|nr:TIGR01459 family HAD-type hydrolase [Lachnospiraceae bacterium OttesenSCG-928-E19]
MIYKSLMDIADNFDTFFFDAWGVFNIGGTISKSAIDVMAELVKLGKSVSIMSNTPQLTSGMIRHYGKKGLIQGVHFQNSFSSGQLCADFALAGKLPVPGKKYYVAWDNSGLDIVNPEYCVLQGTDYIKVSNIDDADFVYCDFPIHNDTLFSDPEFLEPEMGRVISAGKPVICANPDLHVCFGGEFVFTQGTPCKVFEEHGLKVIYYGKPYPEIYLDALQKLGNVDPLRTLMIGDTLHTDILGATRAGIKSCLTISNGITERDLKLAGLEVNEDNIIAAATKIGARVDYIIERVPLVDL